MFDLVIRNGVVVLPDEVRRADVGIQGERIAAIGPDLSGDREIDASGLEVLPGAIDAHTHMELPVRGRRSSDDFLSGTIAAACGGVTTIADFSVGSHEASLPQSIDARLALAARSAIDYTLQGEVVGWESGREDEFALAIDLGVRTFKFYLTYSSSGRMSDDGVLYRAFLALARLGGRAMVHAENDAIIRALTEELEKKGELGIEGLARSRPPFCEAEAIARAGMIALYTGAPLRIAHVSSEAGLRSALAARASGAAIAIETCPQYLLLDERVYATRDGPQYAATPPLRTPGDCRALWKGLSEGQIDLVASDHCPFTREEKRFPGSFLDLPYGLPGVETLFPLLYSEGVGENRIDVMRLVALASSGPARALGIFPQKGAILPGSDADLVLVDPKAEWTIHSSDLHMRTDFCPYEGRRVRGRPVLTIARGRVIYDHGEFLGEEGWGRFVPQRA